MAAGKSSSAIPWSEFSCLGAPRLMDREWTGLSESGLDQTEGAVGSRTESESGGLLFHDDDGASKAGFCAGSYTMKRQSQLCRSSIVEC